MDVLYDKIAALCNQRGISITTMCKDSGASRAAISDLKMGRSKTLSSATLTKIAAYFGVSVDYLLGQEESSATNTNNGAGFHVGDTFADGLVTISDVEQQNDGSIKVTYSIDETGLSADDLMNVLLFLKKAHENAGIPAEQLLDLIEQILHLSQTVQGTPKASPTPAKNSSSTPEEEDPPEA